ncbi:sperm microtubule associated protein 2 isoform X1 [Microcebus murinus]|uniref:Sperm microtubule associated protein 2 n=1 Tax=Microcebus murinus TaxID=30608 RepID=A0A8B7F0Q0_MICMU|nr:testicular haploid expressed gene protein isoform X2 [Microcebus murinus]
MGDTWRGSLNSHLIPELRRDSERREDDDDSGLQSAVFESRRSRDLDDEGAGADGQEEEIPPEEVAGEELDAQNPEEALLELERVLDKGLEDDVPEMSRLSISQRFPRTSVTKVRKRKRLSELAKPKTNWQVVKDRPSVYWTERFLEDTTLAITVPAVSRRVEELSRPRRFYLEYYNNNRTTPIWPIPRSTLEYQASSRLKELAVPKMRNNIWSINMSEVSQVSRAAQTAVASQRIIRLSQPRVPATLLEEWDPVPKPRPHASDYNRLLHLAAPKVQSDKCVPDRDPRWEILDATKKAVASPRIISLAQPKVRKELNEGYNPFQISPASLVAQASPRLYELAIPKNITKKA